MDIFRSRLGNCFAIDSHGNTIFFGPGSRGFGYIVPSLEEKQKIQNFMIVSLVAANALTPVGFVCAQLGKVSLIIFVVFCCTFLVWYH